MALSASTVWEVRSTGNDLNGGAFVPGGSGTDYSQQDSAQMSSSQGACVFGGAELTDSGNPFTSAMVDNHIQIASGTNAAISFFRIISYNHDGSVEIDRSCAVGSDASAIVYKLGGALASPGRAAASVVAGNTIWVKAATYTFSTNSNVTGGRISLTVNQIRLQGYSGTRGDDGKPTFTTSTNYAFPLISCTGILSSVANFTVNLNSQTSCTGATGAGRVSIRNCNFTNCGNVSVIQGFSTVDRCEVTLNSTGNCLASLAQGSLVRRSRFRGASSSNGLGHSGGSVVATFRDCVFDSLQYGANGNWESSTIIENCVARNCTFGFNTNSTNGPGTYINCVADNCTTPFANSGGSTRKDTLTQCAYRGGTYTAANFSESGTIIFTADPFIDAANGDYSLNATAGGGAALRQLGNGSYGWSGSTAYPDIGAVQTQISGSVIVVDD